MEKKYSAPALFKDYNKTTKDLLTKNYTNAGLWKLETKFKGPKDTFFINPQASSDGKISCDVEYVPSACNGSLKVALTPDCCENLKTTATYDVHGHKLEAVVHRVAQDYKYELSHQTCVALQKRASINEKITKDAVELGMGIDVAPNCQVGCGAVYTMKNKICNWNLGCRYAAQGYEVALRTNKFQTYQTSCSAPFSFSYNQQKNKISGRVGVETECGKAMSEKGGVAMMVGMEVSCPVLPANSVKARVDKKGQWAVAYLAKLADNWTLAVSMDASKKAGVLFSHS